MYVKIFQYNCRSFAYPVNVFAQDLGQSAAIFDMWWRNHAKFFDLAEALVEELEHEAVARENPQLADVMITGTLGIGYWLGHREGWVVAAPDDPPAGLVFPLEPADVKCFVFHDEDMGELMLFAPTRESASSSFDHFVDDIDGWDDAYPSITERSPWLLTGDKLPLRLGMEQGL